MKKLLVADDVTPVGAYAALRARSDSPSFLLESAPIGGERWGRYSVIGWRPRRIVTLDACSPEQVRLQVRDVATGRVTREHLGVPGDSLGLLREHAFSEHTSSERDAPRVIDAAVGYVAYDLVHALEPVPGFDEERRLAHLLDGATVIVFDALLQTVEIHAPDQRALDDTLDALAGARARLTTLPVPVRGAAPRGMRASIDDDHYAQLVERAKRYIEAGDIFQVVLARLFTVPRTSEDSFDVYRAMRSLNPSPYLYYLDLRGSGGDHPRAIAGASPETLVRLENGMLTVRPLAGTRPRGRDEEHDRALERELREDPKEVAEHVMLVDLGRNDIGRVASIGSVTVPVQMAVEHYSHVMHLVSEVHGALAPQHDAWAALAATFPAGTLSGAPKVRAMQIIRELEGRPRGIYGGAVGYVSRHGTMDFAIAIRTIVAFEDRFEIGAGAGIVEASDPIAEAQETRHKAGAALAAIAAAQELART